MITFVFVYLSPQQTRQQKNWDGTSQTFQHQTIRERVGPGFIHYPKDISHIANRKSNGEMRDYMFFIFHDQSS